MQVQVIVSIVGQEQQDFINRLTLKTRELGGKWLVNKLSHLDGQIAGLFKLEIDDAKLDAFKQMMATFASIQSFYHQVEANEAHHHKAITLSLDAKDRSGLTSDITHLLLQQDVQVHSFSSKRHMVIELGTSIFEANLDVSLPDTLTVEQLKAELSTLSEQMRVCEV